MDYAPRYQQPFTLAQAISFDLPVIVEEIARLQNSITHLEETQVALKEALDEPGEPDPDLLQAYQENEGVIGSQKERISMLKMALTEKGIVGGPHYDSAPPAEPVHTPVEPDNPATTGDDPDGVYL